MCLHAFSDWMQCYDYDLLILVNIDMSKLDKRFEYLYDSDEEGIIIDSFFTSHPPYTEITKGFMEFLELVNKEFDQILEFYHNNPKNVLENKETTCIFSCRPDAIFDFSNGKSYEELFQSIDPQVKDIVVFDCPIKRIGTRHFDSLYFVWVKTQPYSSRHPIIERSEQLSFAHGFCHILSDINSNHLIKSNLEDKRYKERIQEIQKCGAGDSYSLAVKKTAAMQSFDDFGKMINTLVEIDYYDTNAKSNFAHYFVPDTIDKSIKKSIKDFHLATFAFKKKEDNLFETKLLADSSDPDPVGNREKLIHVMWKTAVTLCGVNYLSDHYHGKVKSDNTQQFQQNDFKNYLELLTSMTQGILAEVPEIVWNTKIDELKPSPTDGVLKLKGQVLALFLLTKIHEWKIKKQIPADSLLSNSSSKTQKADCERLTYLTHLLHVIQYALHMRDDSDIDALRSIIWLISEFGHEALGINRLLDIENNLILIARQQAALFGLVDHYRDHMNHVIQVCLTGWFLLEAKFDNRELYSFILVSPSISPTPAHADFTPAIADYKNLLAKWFVASLLHDVGYVLSIGEGWIKLLASFGTKSLQEIHTRLSESFQHDIGLLLMDSEVMKDLKDKVKYDDHGVISAIHVSESLKSINSDEHKKYQESYHAMAFHGKSKNDLSFQSDFLSILMVLCDEIQEWGRPTIDQTHLSLSMSLPVQKEMTSWRQAIKEVHVNIHANYDNENLVLTLKKKDSLDSLRCSIQYGEEILQQNSLFHVWLARSESFQRLNLTDSPLKNTKFILLSPVKPNHKVHRFRQNETQFERLKRFVRDKHFWGLYHWFDNVEYVKKDEKDQENELSKEEVTLKIDDLCKNKPICDDLSKFFKEFNIWKDSEK